MTDVTDRAPTAGWVLYDDECSRCVTLARWFAATLNKRGFSLASFETPWVRSRLRLRPGASAEMKVLTPDGDSFGGADAVIYLARQIWWAWPLYAIAQIPLGTPTLRWGYRWIAARRHCTNDSCARAESMKRLGRNVGWLPLVVLPCCGVALRSKLPAWALMWVLSVAIYAGCKWLTAWSQNDLPSTRMRRLGYLLAWPGMDAEAFFDTLFRPHGPSRTDWTWAVLKTALGVALLWGVVRHVSPSLPLLRGWVGLLGLFFLLHVGTFHILALLWQTGGVAALPIMHTPALATSLADFWGRRWNLGFHQLAVELVFRPCRNRWGRAGATFAAFLTSGLVHDLVISFPVRAGYGLPTAYFILQAAGLIFERSRLGRAWGLGHGVAGRLFALTLTAGPAFWLFHPWFVTRAIIPFLQLIRAL